MEEEENDIFNIIGNINTDTTTTALSQYNTYDLSNSTTGDVLYSVDGSYTNQPTLVFEIDNESYDIRSIISLLKILMKKEGLDEELLTMDYDKLSTILNRESSLDDLLK